MRGRVGSSASRIALVHGLGAFLGCLFLASILDSCVAGYLEPKREVRLLAGSTVLVSGKAEARIPELNWLAYESESPEIAVDFVECQGRLWRAKVEASDIAAPGSYVVRIFLHGEDEEEARENPVYTVRVFADEAALRSSETSLFRRYAGVSPMAVTAFSFPLMLVCLGLSHRLWSQQESLLHREGIGAVFRAKKVKEGWEIAFALGRDDGIRPGDTIEILDRHGRPAGRARVTSAGASDSIACVPESASLPTDAYVRLVDAPSEDSD